MHFILLTVKIILTLKAGILVKKLMDSRCMKTVCRVFYINLNIKQYFQMLLHKSDVLLKYF